MLIMRTMVIIVQTLFSLTFTMLTTLTGGTQRLSRLVGVALAKEMIFTGKVLSGHQAYEVGLVNRSVDINNHQDTVDRTALDMARSITEQVSLAMVP